MWQRLTRTLFSGIWLALVPLVVQAAPKVVTIAFGKSMPPYVIQESNSGLEMDIVRAALKVQGYALTAWMVSPPSMTCPATCPTSTSVT